VIAVNCRRTFEAWRGVPTSVANTSAGGESFLALFYLAIAKGAAYGVGHRQAAATLRGLEFVAQHEASLLEAEVPSDMQDIGLEVDIVPRETDCFSGANTEHQLDDPECVEAVALGLVEQGSCLVGCQCPPGLRAPRRRGENRNASDVAIDQTSSLGVVENLAQH